MRLECTIFRGDPEMNENFSLIVMCFFLLGSLASYH
jgi:hypothetical protein